ncbi:LysR family transcriptional regulator [Xylophilus sp. Kf1]|nr:LysR family transcriptional regulator [Xylophilus sp. Kf1]
MRRTLPPLATLRPFEAAARLGSFTAAADELALTQGAISLQIRNLESFLGKRLFDRLVRRVELTEDGRQYYAACLNALEEIERATRRMLAQRDHRILTVSCLPTLATMWLMPRLSAFSSAYPDIEVRVATSISAVDLRASDIDVALRVGKLPGRHYRRGLPTIDLVMTDRWDGIEADYLFDDVLVPVVAQKLLSQGAAIETARDLLKYTLIHTASRQNAWRDWLAAQGIENRSRKASAEYGHFFMALQAAQDCKGIAIVPRKLFETFAERPSGLVEAFQADIPSAGEYYMLTHDSRTDNAAVRKFRKWVLLMAQAGGRPGVPAPHASAKPMPA